MGTKADRYGRGWDTRRKIVLERDEYICGICHREGADSVDHIVRIKDGGTHEYSNLRAAHIVCNIRASSRMKRPHLKRRLPAPNRLRRWA